MAMVTNTSKPANGPRFPKSQSGTRVSVSPGKGGKNLGTPTHCASKRSASNLKGIYRYT
jgi:hypothetical protein